MSETREEFAKQLLEMMREPAALGGVPRLSGLSIPEAITRWMAAEFGLYLNDRLGSHGWYPVSLQCMLLNDGLDRWSAVMRVYDGGPPRFQLERTSIGTDLYNLNIGRGPRGHLSKRNVRTRMAAPEEEPDRIFFYTMASDRIDYDSNGLLSRRQPDQYTPSMLRL
jgi:hypothetical protein